MTGQPGMRTALRNAEIVRLLVAGAKVSEVAARYHVTETRLGQIMHDAGYRRVWRWEMSFPKRAKVSQPSDFACP